MHQIILLGNIASNDSGVLSDQSTGNRVIRSDSFEESLQFLLEKKADILVIDRNFTGISSEDLLRIREQGLAPLCLIWPPDPELSSLISLFLSAEHLSFGQEQVSSDNLPAVESLILKNQELTERITTLESVVRSLLTALSQYDISYEAYTGEDAWQLIMQGLPAADQIPDEYMDEDESSDEDEDFDGTDGS